MKKINFVNIENKGENKGNGKKNPYVKGDSVIIIET